LLSPLKLGALALTYPANDSFAHAVADRVALNARDAGIVVQPSPNADGNLRLVRWTLESADSAAELARLARLLGFGDRANGLDSSKPDTLYDTERALLDSNRVIPLAHLPQVYGLAPRVHMRDTAANALTLHFEDFWVDP
jgi:hypothetical protein